MPDTDAAAPSPGPHLDASSGAEPRSRGAESPDRGGPGAGALVLGLLVLVVPLPVWWDVAGDPAWRFDPNQRVSVYLFDAVLAVAGALGWLALARGRVGFGPLGVTARRALAVLAGLSVAVVVVAFAFHPSWFGVAWGLRAAAALGVGFLAVAQRGVDRVAWLAALVVSGTLQATLAVAQSLHGSAVGLPDVVEIPGALYRFGESYAGRGSFGHPYHLVVFLLVAVFAALAGLRGVATMRRWPWLVGVGACGVGVAATYSRTAAFGLAAAAVLVVVALVRPDRARRAVLGPWALVFVAGFAVGALGLGDGWRARGADTAAGAGAASAADAADTLSRGRVERVREALDLAGTSPVVGVGPGRYVEALREAGIGPAKPQAAHNAVAHAAAEFGLLGGVLAVAWALTGLWWAARRGLLALAAFAVVVPFFVFDAFPYTWGAGLVTTALWLVVCRDLGVGPAAPDPGDVRAGAAASPSGDGGP